MPLDSDLVAQLVGAATKDLRSQSQSQSQSQSGKIVSHPLNPYTNAQERRSWQNGYEGKAAPLANRSIPFLRGMITAQLMQFQGEALLLLELDHAPHPGIRSGYWNATPSEGLQIVAVASFAQASQKATEYIARNDLGSSNWTGGTVRNERGITVAQISYNGRVWSPDGIEIALTESGIQPAEPEAQAPAPTY